MGDHAIKLIDEYKSVVNEHRPSLEALFRDHHDRVFLAAYRVCGNVQDAEDVLQSVFLRLLHWSARRTVGVNPSSYLSKAAINASLDILRAKRRRPTVALDESGDEADPLAPPADIDVHRAEQRNHLRVALASLSPRPAEMFALRYFEDFGNAEIAELMGTSSSSVAVTLHRTRDRLQELLREFEGDRS
jgi:RNA polymerase sigma factor (sigma-70 family)